MVRILAYRKGDLPEIHPAFLAMYRSINPLVDHEEFWRQIRAKLDGFDARWYWNETMDTLSLEFPGEDQYVMWRMVWE